MKCDHLKPAPCVSTKFLAVLRMLFSLALGAQTISCIVYTGNSDHLSFYYISQWNLVLITILFTTMAVIQIKHERRLTTFTVGALMRRDSTRSFSNQDSVIIEENSNEGSANGDDGFD